MRGEEVRQARTYEAPLQHLVHGVRSVSRLRQFPALAVGRAEERRFVVLAGDAWRRPDIPVAKRPDRDGPGSRAPCRLFPGSGESDARPNCGSRRGAAWRRRRRARRCGEHTAQKRSKSSEAALSARLPVDSTLVKAPIM